MSDTADRILDSVQSLIQTRGYSAISFQNIADELGIKKAGIHYHFSTKTVLGVAVIKRYGERSEQMLAHTTKSGAGSWAMLDCFLAPFREFGDTPDKICLCGALGGEFLALRPEMRTAVADFFAQQQNWLGKLLRDGRRSGDFAFKGSARRQARLAFSSLQGALLVKRTNADKTQLTDVIRELKARLKPEQV